MTFWDFLDKHELIGPGMICFCVFWGILGAVDIAGHIARRKS